MPSQNAHRILDLAEPHVLAMRVRPGPLALVVATGEVGRDGEPLDVLDVRGRGEQRAGGPPGAAGERRATLRQCAAHGIQR
jgi:hypothetical protein